MVYLVDAQAKELDNFRKFVGLRALPGDANTVENDDQTEFTATSPATSEYHSPLDEVGQSVTDVNQETGLYRNEIPAQAHPTTHVLEFAGLPLDDSNNEVTSEVSKSTNLQGILNSTVSRN